MPRVTKASNKKETKSVGKTEVDTLNIIEAKSTAKKSASKTVKKEAPKKSTAKKTTEKKATAKKTTASTTSKKTTKKDDTALKKTTKKTTSTRTSKKASTTSSKAKKSTTSRKKTVTKTAKTNPLEYYDLPYRYNQTVVRILAQTPTTLFVYWDVSDDDRQRFVKEFGENFFNDTYPVLIVHNRTKNYTFEISVNDFANSWYFKVSDTKCDYEIEFGRRKKTFTEISIPNDYVYITSSNVIEAPNDRFLFEPNTKTIFFRNVKTNQEFSKDVATISFMEKISKIYNIYDIYKEIYKEEDLIDAINNPTSSGSSSVFYQNKN